MQAGAKEQGQEQRGAVGRSVRWLQEQQRDLKAQVGPGISSSISVGETDVPALAS